jgi:hypothetical protein
MNSNQPEFSNLDTLSLSEHEVEQYRQGLSAINEEAARRGVALMVTDVKDKHGEPVVSFVSQGNDEGLEELFTEAMRKGRADA